MAQSKLNDLAGRFGKGPKGLGTGMKLLGLAGAAAYGISQSLFTGNRFNISRKNHKLNKLFQLRVVIALSSSAG